MTNKTWNPIIGCSKISEGCKNCYAEKMANRLACIEKTGESYSNVVTMSKNSIWSGKTHFVESALEKPLKWKKPRMIFVCSMSDLFHESVSNSWINFVMNIIQKCSQHTFQILTKRPEKMRKYFHGLNIAKILPNAWLGVTAENQEQANKRIPILLQIPAKVRFVSVEPMLSNIDISSFLYEAKLDWVICGGESGHNARPIHPNWVRSLRDQCKQADVPFFFKQWGAWDESSFRHFPKRIKRYIFESDGKLMVKIGRKKAGSSIDGKEYKQLPKL